MTIGLKDVEKKLFIEYINKCAFEGFAGINNYERVNKEREFFYKWHFRALLLKCQKTNRSQRGRVVLIEPEVMTLHALFNRVDCCPEMVILQKKFYI